MKKLYFIMTVVIGLTLVGCGSSSGTTENQTTNMSQTDIVLHDAFKNKTDDLQVTGSGQVTKLLPDDTKGIKHQRFILELASKQTLLISHNIDLAERINTLKEDDIVEFYGEYEWNVEGGLVHWTHIDPKGVHEDGWLKHKGETYQ